MVVMVVGWWWWGDGGGGVVGWWWWGVLMSRFLVKVSWLLLTTCWLPFQNLGNLVHPILSVSFGRYTKSRWSLLSGVYARGSKRSHTGKWKNLLWTQCA